MTRKTDFEVIIIGGSYSGLASGMALGRALRKVLIIDSGKPCNLQTPYSHNFLTQDGKTPQEIKNLALHQVQQYSTISFLDGLVKDSRITENIFEILTLEGEKFTAKKIVLATGVKDIFPALEGFSSCWGISVIHCPYCHGFEVRYERTGILGNGEYGFEFSKMISHWTKELTLFTNGKSTLSSEQMAKLEQHSIPVVEKEIQFLEHENGFLKNIVFKDASKTSLKALYAKPAFEQNGTLHEKLGCNLNEDGYIIADPFQKTSVPGVFACGDNTTRMRSVANSVSQGTTTGAMVNRELIEESF